MSSFVTSQASPPRRPELVDGFVTDESGYHEWNIEHSGLRVLARDEAVTPPADGVWYALCWFEGDFVVNRDDVGAPPTTANSLVVAVEHTAREASAYLIAASTDPIAVLAPAVPRSGAAALSDGRPERVARQPDGVTVREDAD